MDVNPCSPSGVLFKIRDQTSYWGKNGCYVQLIFICPVKDVANPLIESANIFSSNLIASLRLGIFKTQINKIFNARKIKRFIENFSPDIIYIRQGSYFPGLGRILRISTVVLEINTDDLREIRHYHWLRAIAWRCSRPLILNSVSAFVFTANELNRRFSTHKKPGITIGNSIDLSRVNECTAKKESNLTKLIFVGSPGLVWSGIDKVLILAQKFGNYEFHVVGDDPTADSPKNVIWHGYQTGNTLNKLYSEMHIGIATLALYRKGLDECTPLKVREYMAHGLPTIVGYEDTDLKGEQFILNIGNHPENVEDNLNEIRSFVEFWKDKRIPRKEIFDKIDVSIKEAQRLKFFKELIENLS